MCQTDYAFGFLPLSRIVHASPRPCCQESADHILSVCLWHSCRYEQEQALVQEELLRLAKREREAAGETLSTALQRERNSTNEERKRVAQLVSNNHLHYIPMWDRLELLCLKGFIKCHLYVEFRNCFSLKHLSSHNSTPWLMVWLASCTCCLSGSDSEARLAGNGTVTVLEAARPVGEGR